MLATTSSVYSALTVNSISAYLYAIGAMLIAALVFWIIQRTAVTYADRAAQHTKNRIDDAIVAMVRSVKPPFYWFLAFYIGLRLLVLPAIVDRVIDGLLLLWILYYAIQAGSIAIDMVVSRASADSGERMARRMLAALAKGALWAIAILLFLSNLGVNITSLIAGLGIGGVAVAFALQNILADLFSSFALFFDKPFVVGDFIIVGDTMGTVEKVGIKTTRLRALQGEEVSIPNRELTNSRVQNFKRMRERRIEMNFGITYETPRDTVAGLPEKIRSALEGVKGIRIDRVHFSGFGDSALNYQLVYFVTSADYNEYMDRQQEINLALIDLFAAEGVSFAYPTRMVYTAPVPTA